MPQYTIAAVDPNPPRQWAGQQGGQNLSYRVDMSDESGFVTRNVEWSKRADKPAPQVGEKANGTIDMEAKFGPKFKPEYQQGGGGGGKREWVPEPPEKRRSIAMQHAQKCAVELLSLGALHGDYKPPERVGDLANNVKAVAVVLFQQVMDAEKEPTDG
jgi:hypothetical protein